MSGLPCAYPRCTHVSIEGTLEELESEGWIVFAPLGRKPVALCPYCGTSLDRRLDFWAGRV